MMFNELMRFAEWWNKYYGDYGISIIQPSEIEDYCEFFVLSEKEKKKKNEQRPI